MTTVDCQHMYHREGQHFIRERRGRRAIWWRRATWWWRARERRRRRAMGKRRRSRRVNSGWEVGWLELSREYWGEFEGELEFWMISKGPHLGSVESKVT